MAHLHDIRDNDSHFIIDPETRNITNRTGKMVTVMQYDHNSERVTFEIPKDIEGHDMSLSDVVQVFYENNSKGTSASSRVTVSGANEVLDLAPAEDDPDTLVFSWLIGQQTTQHVGTIRFQIRFVCHSDDEEVPEYSWRTNLCTAFTVLPSLNTINDMVDVNPDVFIELDQRMDQLERKGVSDERLNNSVSEYVDNYLEAIPLTAYDIAVKYGYNGSEEEWLRSLDADTLPKTIKYVFAGWKNGIFTEHLDNGETLTYEIKRTNNVPTAIIMPDGSTMELVMPAGDWSDDCELIEQATHVGHFDHDATLDKLYLTSLEKDEYGSEKCTAGFYVNPDTKNERHYGYVLRFKTPEFEGTSKKLSWTVPVVNWKQATAPSVEDVSDICHTTHWALFSDESEVKSYVNSSKPWETMKDLVEHVSFTADTASWDIMTAGFDSTGTHLNVAYKQSVAGATPSGIYYSDDRNGWYRPEGLGKTITFPGEQKVSYEFYRWLTANAALSSGRYKLSGTWTFNDIVKGPGDITSGTIQFGGGGFTSDGATTWNLFYVNIEDNRISISYNGDVYYDSENGWCKPEDFGKTVTFTGEEVSWRIYNWIIANATCDSSSTVTGTWTFNDTLVSPTSVLYDDLMEHGEAELYSVTSSNKHGRLYLDIYNDQLLPNTDYYLYLGYEPDKCTYLTIDELSNHELTLTWET